MALSNVLALQITDVAACVKIDDTVPGVEEGVHAGMWSVGVVLSGNEVGCTRAELAALSQPELTLRKAQAESRLLAAGAHYVIDTINDLPTVLEQIQIRLRNGERP